MQRWTRVWLALALTLTLTTGGCGRAGEERKAAGGSQMQEGPAVAPEGRGQTDTVGATGETSRDTAVAESAGAVTADTSASSMEARNLFVVLFRRPVTDEDLEWLKDLGFRIEKKTGDSEVQVSLPQGTPVPPGVRDAPRVLRFQQVMR